MGRLRNGVYEQVAADVARGKYRWGDRACPICEIGDFSKEPQSMLGFKKGTPIETRFYVVLRLVLKPVGKGGPQTIAVRWNWSERFVWPITRSTEPKRPCSRLWSPLRVWPRPGRFFGVRSRALRALSASWASAPLRPTPLR